MEYMVVVVAFLSIVVIYLCWAVQFLYRKFVFLAKTEKARNKKDVEILGEILKALKAEVE